MPRGIDAKSVKGVVFDNCCDEHGSIVGWACQPNSETVHSPLTTHHSLKKSAFTLAEVLITLGIIGVVAALTIPNLIAKYQLMECIAAYKKTISILNQAAAKVVTDLGNVPDCYIWLSGESPYPAMDTCIKKNDIGACIQWGDNKGNPRPSDYQSRNSECSIYKAELLKNLKIIKNYWH